LDKFTEGGFEAADPVDIAELVADKLLLEALAAALNELDPQNRIIAELYGAGLSEREIAAQVGLSPKGVHKRKAKIFDQLRRQLKDWR